jgi:predicted CoA-binding protein
MAEKQQLERFLAAEMIGVVGASRDRAKFGNKVLRCYQQKGYQAIPVHPAHQEIEGMSCVASVSELPVEAQSISVITPPRITEKVVQQAAAKGIRNIWLQPGAQSAEAILFCQEKGINLIADGTCVLVVLGFDEH